MRVLGHRRSGVWPLMLLGTVIGSVAGLWIGRALQLRTAERGLSDYAYVLTKHAEETFIELDAIFASLNSSQLPYCSDPEIQAMQAQTFKAPDLKDIGRTREGKFYCSAFLGRLTRPYIEGPPTLVLAGGEHVYTNVPVVLATFDGNRATVIESGNADAVLSPSAFDRWDRPNNRYMIAMVNRSTGQMAGVAGSNLKIDARKLISRELRATVAGVVYRSHCSYIHSVCAITAESIVDIWASSKAIQLAYLAMGGFAGFSLGFALALLYRQATSLSHQLQRDIRRSASSLRMVYQPIMDVNSRRCVGAEALIRWTDHDGKAVAPDVFVRIAEEKGFIGELTAFVVRQSLRDVGYILRQHPDFTLSINIAASDMLGAQLIQLLEKYVVDAGIHPSQIALELTERSTAELGAVKGAIRGLCGKGYKVHIDDFGTGFSSLSYLNQLAVNVIKIDRSFTRTIGTDAITAPILPQMLAMAEALQVAVIVEGVENQEQADYLEATGRDIHGQGWFFGKPMPPGDLAKIVEQNSKEPLAQPAPLEIVSQV